MSKIIPLRFLFLAALSFMAFAVQCEPASADVPGYTNVSKTFIEAGFGSDTDTATAKFHARVQAILKADGFAQVWKNSLPAGSLFFDLTITIEYEHLSTIDGVEFWAATCTYTLTMSVPDLP